MQQSADGQTTPYIITLLHACKVLNNCATAGWSGPPDCGGLVHVHQGHLLHRTTAPAAANWRPGSHRRHRGDTDREEKARQCPQSCRATTVDVQGQMLLQKQVTAPADIPTFCRRSFEKYRWGGERSGSNE